MCIEDKTLNETFIPLKHFSCSLVLYLCIIVHKLLPHLFFLPTSGIRACFYYLTWPIQTSHFNILV